MALHARTSVNPSSGQRSMLSLLSPLACSPMENMHASLGEQRVSAFWWQVTWNVKSLVDTEGSVKTVIQGQDVRHKNIKELTCNWWYISWGRMKVAALQKNLWFGSAAYHVQYVHICTHVASIPPEQPYILFVDFNVCVESQSVAHDLQDGVWGPEGYGECNDAGSRYRHVSLPRKPQCAVHGSITSPFTNRLGCTQCQSTGIALICDRRTEYCVWLWLWGEELNATQIINFSVCRLGWQVGYTIWGCYVHARRK